MQGWVDVFTRNEYKEIMIDNLAYCQKNKGLERFARCLITNHVHIFARATQGNNLANILRDFKKFTSKAVLKAVAEDDRESQKEWLLTNFKTEKSNQF